MRATKFMLAIAMTVAVAAPPGTAGESAGMGVYTDVPIPMSDGIRLYGDVHLPDGEGPFPVLLNLTPYGPGTYLTSFLGQGYARVNVDIRGTGRSEGFFCVLCAREQRDAYEVIEWVAAQPWSDGNVGMHGGSYQGITPLLAAAQQSEHLKAVVPSVAYTDTYRDIVWHNGLWNSNFLAQWTTAQAVLSASGTSTTSDPVARVDNVIVLETRDRPFDGPWYHERSIYTKHDDITVPTLNLGGWFDGFSRATVRNYQGIASKDSRLVMNPCTHKGCGGPFDPLSPYDGAGVPGGNPTLAWFDRFVRGIDNGVEDGPEVLYYDLGAERWESAEMWPPPDAEPHMLYLSGEPSGSVRSLNDGSLVAAPPGPEGRGSASYLYDPSQGLAEIFSKWGTVAATPHIRIDQRVDEPKALTFTTAISDQPLVIAGPMELHLWAATTASDADWIVKVSDVTPDGTSLLITSGYVRSSHREWDPERSRPGEPWLPNERALEVPAETPLEHRIDIWDIAHTIKPGHRLRITILSNDQPNHEPYPEPGVNTVLHDAEHPSRLLINAPVDVPCPEDVPLRRCLPWRPRS